MQLPKLSLQEVGWGELISIIAWATMAVYIAAIMRADQTMLKLSKEDHETRIRVIEKTGSDLLRMHVVLDDERQKSVETELRVYREESTRIRESLARLDSKVDILLNQKRSVQP